MRTLHNELQDQLAKQTVCPGEPAASEVGGIVHVEALMHEACVLRATNQLQRSKLLSQIYSTNIQTCTGNTHHVETILDLLVAIARHRPHDDSNGPGVVVAFPVRTAHTLTCRAIEVVWIP